MQPDVSYEERPVAILDYSERILRSKVVPLVRVQWGHHNMDESTWEWEEDMREQYPELFIAGIFPNFEDEIPFVRGKVCNTP